MANERTYRGRRLRKVEWGLWKDLDRSGWYLVEYRTRGTSLGTVRVRRWYWVDEDAAPAGQWQMDAEWTQILNLPACN